ncbi:hypothetical protein BJ875DRAFT_204432 [Amylocarpus encephaloides]|uniref:DUF6590 domain-containing protein n=1 Tax=Amylocarpus encephaloides TaxID=45428 RepID=A0A9P8C7X5_9HELO|nr:hypothetical protein BJ875DRAFT_204432 [Amylocarpus encephaloides]
MQHNLALLRHRSRPWKSSENDTDGQLSDTNLSSSSQAREPSLPVRVLTRDHDGSTEGSGFDKNYRVHHRRSFKLGKIFKVFWSEPSGTTNRSVASEVGGAKGEKEFHAKVRRFLVVRQWEGHCIGLALHTYGGQGTKKPGVRPKDHAVVYENTPSIAPGEELDLPCIRFVPNGPRDRLDPMTRLNYAKIYTVECNVKVCFIGAVHKESVLDLIRTYNSIHTPLSIPTPDRVESSGKTLTSKAERSNYVVSELNQSSNAWPRSSIASTKYPNDFHYSVPTYSSRPIASNEPIPSYAPSAYTYGSDEAYSSNAGGQSTPPYHTPTYLYSATEPYPRTGSGSMPEYHIAAHSPPLPSVLTRPKDIKEDPAQPAESKYFHKEPVQLTVSKDIKEEPTQSTNKQVGLGSTSKIDNSKDKIDDLLDK